MRKWKNLRAVPVSLKFAGQLVNRYHRHNSAPQGAKYAIAAATGYMIVGVAITGRPISRGFDDGLTAECLRVCTIDHLATDCTLTNFPANGVWTLAPAPKGTTSFLLAASWRAARAMGYERMITYTLQRESGASMKGAGWRILHEVRPKRKFEHGWGSRRGRKYQDVLFEPKICWERRS